jgi:SHAQKYF class myb-like DNA-binding protein
MMALNKLTHVVAI